MCICRRVTNIYACIVIDNSVQPFAKVGEAPESLDATVGDVGATRADNPFLSRKKKMIRKKKAEPTTKPPAKRKLAARRVYGENTAQGLYLLIVHVCMCYCIYARMSVCLSVCMCVCNTNLVVD